MEIVLAATGFLGLLAWGDWLFARLFPGWLGGRLERALVGFGLLFGAGAYAIHVIGFAGLLYKPLSWTFLLLCAVGIVLWVADRLRRADKPGEGLILSGFDWFFFPAICIVAFVTLLGCLTPEIRDDCLHNHQGIPAGYTNAHRIDMHPYNGNMGRPQLLHAYYMLSLLFQNVFGPKLVHSMLALVGLAAMWWLATETCDRKSRWAALYLFYTLPVVAMYAVCAYVDLGRVFYELLPLGLVLRFQQSRRWRDLVLGAVVCGFGMGVHWVSLFFGWPVLTATVFLAVALGGGEGRWKRAFGAAAVFGAISAAVFSPWIVRNWILLGNPAQPLFRVPAGSAAAQHFSPEVLAYFGALKELPQRLYRAVWVISQSGNCPPILLIIALILKFALRDRDPRRSAMLIFSFLHLTIFAVTLPIQDGRYILPGFAVSVLLFFHYAEAALSNYPRYRPMLLAGIAALGLMNFGVAKHRLHYEFHEPPWPVYDREAVERFLTDRFGDRSMIHYVNDELPSGSKVLLDGAVGALYFWRPFMARNYGDPRILDSLVRKSADNAELLEDLRRFGLTHVLVEVGTPVRAGANAEVLLKASDFPTAGLDENQEDRLHDFVERHLRPIHRVGRQVLYRIEYESAHRRSTDAAP